MMDMSKRQPADRKSSKAALKQAKPTFFVRNKALILGLTVVVAAGVIFVAGNHFRAGKDTSSASKPYVTRPSGQLTFSKDVAPIIFKNCSSCHRPDQSGPFSL